MTQSKNTKRALLASVLSIVLCFAMLIGSTFAWFTDSVSSGENRIVAGNLDVELYYKTGNMTDYENVNGAEKNPFFRDAEGNPIKWEPGVMAYTHFKVTNEGSLALKYALTSVASDFNTLTTDGVAHNLSEVIKFAVIDGDEAVEGRDDAKLFGLAYAGFDTFKADGELAAKPAEGESSDSFTVVAYWEPTASDNLYNVNNGAEVSDIEDNPDNTLWLNIEVNLKATQDTVENDSFGNDYDKNAWIEMKMTDNHNGTYSDDEGQLYVKNDEEYLVVTQYVDGEGNAVEGRYTDENDNNYIASDNAIKSVFQDSEAVQNDIALISDITYEGIATGTSANAKNILHLAADTKFDLGGNTLTVNSKNGKDGVYFLGGSFESNPAGSEARIVDGTITQTKTYGSSYAVVVAEHTTLTLENVSVEAEDSGYAVRCAGYKDTIVILNNCEITGKIIVGSQATLKINDSCVVGLINPMNNAIVEITSGRFSEKPQTSWLADGSTLSAETDGDGYWVVTAAN